MQPEFDDGFSCKNMCGRYIATGCWLCGLCTIWQDRWADSHIDIVMPVNTMAPLTTGSAASRKQLDQADQSLIQGDAFDGEGVLRSLG